MRLKRLKTLNSVLILKTLMNTLSKSQKSGFSERVRQLTVMSLTLRSLCSFPLDAKRDSPNECLRVIEHYQNLGCFFSDDAFDFLSKLSCIFYREKH